MQRPPRRERTTFHLQRDGDVDEGGLREVTRRAGREDGHRLRQHRPCAVGEGEVGDRRRAGGERGDRGGERAVVPGHPRAAEVEPQERAHRGHEHREERTEQERRGEQRRVVDGQLDLEREVDGPDLRERREPEKDADDEQVLRRVQRAAEDGEGQRRGAGDDHAADICPQLPPKARHLITGAAGRTCRGTSGWTFPRPSSPARGPFRSRGCTYRTTPTR